mmetsp:Transcript_93002/g.259992  ORF Transcript_93002/g.259992 Transcript_93002/m.259992 type:complete len:273 (-) Transcript_93002:60-878(-)
MVRGLAALPLVASCALAVRTTGAWRRRNTAPAALLLGGAAAQGLPGALHFQALDTNEDGSVDRMELMYGIRDILDGIGADKASRDEVYREASDLYHIADLDGDGVLGNAEVEYAQLCLTMPSEFSTSGAHAVHKSLDLDGDGFVNRSEFAEFLFQSAPAGRAEKMLEDVFPRADVNGDGVLSWPECHFGLLLFVDFTRWGAVAVMFQGLDMNQDGKLSRQEVEQVMEESRDPEAELEMCRQILEGFGAADADGDGYLDRNEVKWLADRMLGG